MSKPAERPSQASKQKARLAWAVMQVYIIVSLRWELELYGTGCRTLQVASGYEQ